MGSGAHRLQLDRRSRPAASRINRTVAQAVFHPDLEAWSRVRRARMVDCRLSPRSQRLAQKVRARAKQGTLAPAPHHARPQVPLRQEKLRIQIQIQIRIGGVAAICMLIRCALAVAEMARMPPILPRFLWQTE